MIFSGAGFGFIFTAGVVVTAQQFDKWRTFAFGVTSCGIATSNLLQPLLASWLSTQFGWRGAFVLTGALILNVCPAAMVIRLCSKDTSKVTDCSSIYDIAVNYDDENFNEKKIITEIETDYKPAASLWTLKYFVLHLNGFLFCFAQSVVFTHIVALVVSKGHSFNSALHLVSAIGFFNIFGRIFLGLAARKNFCFSLASLFTLTYVTAGVSCLILAYTPSYAVSFILASIIGFCMAAYGPVYSEYLCTIIDPTDGNHFAHAYGILLVSLGVGTLFGAPFAGLLFDWTLCYKTSFIVSAVSLVLAGLVVYLPKLTK